LTPLNHMEMTPAEVLTAFDQGDFDMYGQQGPEFKKVRAVALGHYHSIRKPMLERYERWREASLGVFVLDPRLEKPDWNAHFANLKPAWDVYLQVVNRACDVYRQTMAVAYVAFRGTEPPPVGEEDF